METPASSVRHADKRHAKSSERESSECKLTVRQASLHRTTDAVLGAVYRLLSFLLDCGLGPGTSLRVTVKKSLALTDKPGCITISPVIYFKYSINIWPLKGFYKTINTDN